MSMLRFNGNDYQPFINSLFNLSLFLLPSSLSLGCRTRKTSNNCNRECSRQVRIRPQRLHSSSAADCTGSLWGPGDPAAYQAGASGIYSSACAQLQLGPVSVIHRAFDVSYVERPIAAEGIEGRRFSDAQSASWCVPSRLSALRFPYLVRPTVVMCLVDFGMTAYPFVPVSISLPFWFVGASQRNNTCRPFLHFDRCINI